MSGESFEYIKASIMFHTGHEVGFEDLDSLSDAIDDALYSAFPEHSGACILISAVDEDGNGKSLRRK